MSLWKFIQRMFGGVTEVEISLKPKETVPEVGIKKEPLFYIKITQIPYGDAPEWVREGWVGLELPCLEETGTGGCGLNPFSRWEQTSAGMPVDPRGTVFVVPVQPALEILEKKNSDAAQWFRDQRVSCMGDFTFSTKEAERVHHGQIQEVRS